MDRNILGLIIPKENPKGDTIIKLNDPTRIPVYGIIIVMVGQI